MSMRKSFIVLALCLLLPLVLCSCDMQGIVGELLDAQAQKETAQIGGALGMEIVGTDDNGNYVVNGENGTFVFDGDAFVGSVDGSYAVIVGGNGSFDYTINVADPLAEIDAYMVSAFTPTKDKSDYVKITVRDYGEIVVRLRPKSAPETVANFKKMVSRGFYNGLVFHRVIQNFMIMSGRYDEFGNEKKPEGLADNTFESYGIQNDLRHVRGVISMANTSDPNDRASSLFFICDADNPDLDGRYTTFGYVVAGMDVVDKIAAVPTQEANAEPYTPVVIECVEFVVPNK